MDKTRKGESEDEEVSRGKRSTARNGKKFTLTRSKLSSSDAVASGDGSSSSSSLGNSSSLDDNNDNDDLPSWIISAARESNRSRRLPTPLHSPSTPREVVSLHLDYNPTAQNPKEFSRWCRGASEVDSVTRKIVRDTKDLDENRWDRSKSFDELSDSLVLLKNITPPGRNLKINTSEINCFLCLLARSSSHIGAEHRTILMIPTSRSVPRKFCPFAAAVS